MNKSEIAEKARKRFAFEQYAKTVIWNTYEGDDDPFAFFPESGVYANGDIQIAWLGWQWRERAIAESQAPQPLKESPRNFNGTDSIKIGIELCDHIGYHGPKKYCPTCAQNAELGDGEPSPPPQDWAENWAKDFHDTYERTAPKFGYETRKESAKPWAEVPENNRKLMIAVCAEVLCRFEKWRSGAAQEVSPPSPEPEFIDFCDSPCGHSSRYAYTENGGKNIECLLCNRQAERDTRELKAALRQCYHVLWYAQFEIPDMIDAKRAALKEIKRLLG